MLFFTSSFCPSVRPGWSGLGPVRQSRAGDIAKHKQKYVLWIRFLTLDVFPQFGPWTLDFLIFDLKIGFYVKNPP